jgi:outer membrane receptor protein involved in Fe transport
MVKDADFFVPVSGASVSLEPGGKAMVTDSEGRFFANELEAGVYRIVVSKEGYIRGAVSGVVVSAGVLQETEIQLTAEVVELDEFVVSTIEEEELTVGPVEIGAPLQSFAQAVAPSLLKASGSGGDIGSAAKRLTSTAVVDSRYVVVRGLSDRYNVVLLNGARIPSSDPDRRAVNIDIFPTGLVETLVSSKTFVPWMPGEATGGSLNVVTKRLPQEPFFNFSVSNAFNTRTTGSEKFLAYRGSGTGIIGTSRERALPVELQRFEAADLPSDVSTTSFTDPSVQPSDDINRVYSNNRLRAAELLFGRATGVTTRKAPENFSVSALGGLRIPDFLGGELGLVGGITYAKRYTLEEGTRGRAQVSPFDLEIGSTYLEDYSRGQEGLLAGALLSGSIEWEEDTISLTYFTNLAAEDEAVFALGENDNLATLNNGIPVEQERRVIFREALGYTQRYLQTMQLAGEHRFPELGDIKTNWVAAFSTSYQDQPDLRKSFTAYDFDAGSDIAAGDPSPPDNERVWRRSDDQSYYLALDVELPIGGGREDEDRAKMKFGGAFDRTDREYSSENFEYLVNSATSLQQPISTSPNDRENLTLADQIGSGDLTDRTALFQPGIPPQPPFPALPDRILRTDNIFLTRGRSLPVREVYTASQTIPAAHGAVVFNLSDDLEVMAGGRVEHTDIRFDVPGINLLDPAQGAGLILLNDPITGQPYPPEQLANPSIVRTDLLPALGVKWTLADDMYLRTAVTRTVARPNFKEIAPVFSREPSSGDIFIGNVLLDMSDVVNYDVRWEWILGGGDLVAVNFFAKTIANPIEQVNLGLFNTARNEIGASLYGFEVEMFKNLGEIVPVLTDWTFGLNYGYVSSKVDLIPFNEQLRRDAGLSADRPLQGQPEYTFNASVTYDNKDLGTSAGILLNVTGSLLYAVGGRVNAQTIPDIFQLPFTSLDAYLSKKVFENWELGIRVTNLLDEPRRREYGRGVPYAVTQAGTIYSVSVTGKW